MEDSIKKFFKANEKAYYILKSFQYIGKFVIGVNLGKSLSEHRRKIVETSAFLRKMIRVFESAEVLMKTKKIVTKKSILSLTLLSRLLFTLCDHILLVGLFKRIPKNIEKPVMIARNLF